MNLKRMMKTTTVALILVLGLFLVACNNSAAEIWGEWSTVEATCTAQGYDIRTSDKGNEEKKDYVAALGHDLDWETVNEPDCENDGEMLNGTCQRQGCGHAVESQIIEKLGHDYDIFTVISEPDCENPGQEARVCTRPGCNHKTDMRDAADLPALGHHVTEWTGNGDYTWSGVCERCNDLVTTDYIEGITANCVLMTLNGVEFDFSDTNSLMITVKEGLKHVILGLMDVASPEEFCVASSWHNWDPETYPPCEDLVCICRRSWDEFDILNNNDDWLYLYNTLFYGEDKIIQITDWAIEFARNTIVVHGEDDIEIIGIDVFYGEDYYREYYEEWELFRFSITIENNTVTIINQDYFGDFIFTIVFEI